MLPLVMHGPAFAGSKSMFSLKQSMANVRLNPKPNVLPCFRFCLGDCTRDYVRRCMRSHSATKHSHLSEGGANAEVS
jgi:hypothetical protein